MAETCKICEKRIPWGEKYKIKDGFVCRSCMSEMGIYERLGKKDCPKYEVMSAAEIITYGEASKAKKEAERAATKAKPVFDPSQIITVQPIDNLLLVDEANQLFRANVGNYGLRKEWKEFRFDQLVGFETYENEGVVTTGGGYGRAVIGGALFGQAGAIVGGLSKEQATITTEMKVVFQVNDSDRLNETIWVWHSDEKNGLSTTSPYYSTRHDQIMEITALFNKILSQNEASSAPTMAPPVSIADEILKLKQLFDMGALNEEQFTEAKRKVIGL